MINQIRINFLIQMFIFFLLLMRYLVLLRIVIVVEHISLNKECFLAHERITKLNTTATGPSTFIFIVLPFIFVFAWLMLLAATCRATLRYTLAKLGFNIHYLSISVFVRGPHNLVNGLQL